MTAEGIDIHASLLIQQSLDTLICPQSFGFVTYTHTAKLNSNSSISFKQKQKLVFLSVRISREENWSDVHCGAISRREFASIASEVYTRSVWS
jgi:hypothetical protein